jgi:hypothetical protein
VWFFDLCKRRILPSPPLTMARETTRYDGTFCFLAVFIESNWGRIEGNDEPIITDSSFYRAKASRLRPSEVAS